MQVSLLGFFHALVLDGTVYPEHPTSGGTMSEAEPEKKPTSDKAPPPAKKTAAKKTTHPAPTPAEKKAEAAPPKEEKKEEKKQPEKPDYSKGDVKLSELKMLTKDSDSVRRLQTALGTNVTGDFDRGTQRALKAWQNRFGFDGGRGIQVNENQTKLLFGDGYTIS